MIRINDLNTDKVFNGFFTSSGLNDMFGEPHDLHHEFPDYHERIRQLKMENNYFSKLSDSYEDVVKELHRIETQIETPEDIYVEELKKKRLFLKDEIYAMLTS